MRSLILAAFVLLATLPAQSQKLKDLLYSGKLRNDSNTVIRKTDDLSTKIDTAAKKPVEVPKDFTAAPDAGPEKARPAATAPVSTTAAPVKTEGAVKADTGSVTVTSAEEAPVSTAAAPVKSTGRIWKEYTDSLTKAIKPEIDANKKIKKEMYYVTVDYEIDPSGAVSVNNVITSPENAYLQATLKEKMQTVSPQLSPVSKKVKRKYNFTFTKD